MSYEDTAPAADKVLHADGSVTTMAGEVILPADQNRAEEYAKMSPTAAKWLLPDGSVVAEIPTPPIGAAYMGTAAPNAAVGDIGDFYITHDGIYTKRSVPVDGGFILSCSNAAFNGHWRDMGVNEIMSSSGGNPQGSHYYQHEGGIYFLVWNTAYGGYWWIGTQLNQDNGSATAYRNTATHTEIPPNDNWSGALSGALTWTPVETSSSLTTWVRCFDFKGINNVPHYKNDRLMKYSEGLTKDFPTNGNMARLDANNMLFVGDSLFYVYSPTGATQALSIGSYRNFKVNLSAAAITLSFSGSVPTGNYPCTLKVWLIPKSTVNGMPKHTVTWPSSVSWIGDEDHKFIGKTGQPDTPVLVELTTFDNGSKWIGRALNVLYPEQEV